MAIHATDNFGNLASGNGVVSGIFALGGESKKKYVGSFGAVTRNRQFQRISILQQREHHLLRCPRIRCALEHDQLTVSHVWSNRFHGLRYVAKIGFAILSQGRRHTDHDGVHFGDLGEICRCLKTATSGKSYLSLRNPNNIRSRGSEHPDLGVIDIESCNREAFLGE